MHDLINLTNHERHKAMCGRGHPEPKRKAHWRGPCRIGLHSWRYSKTGRDKKKIVTNKLRGKTLRHNVTIMERSPRVRVCHCCSHAQVQMKTGAWVDVYEHSDHYDSWNYCVSRF